METEIILALISLLGSIIGTFGGIAATARLTTYRIEQLEKKVDKHNNLIDRTYAIEKEIAIIKEEMK